MSRKPEGPLRRGWTTGACAAAAAKAAAQALLTGEFPDPVTITLPRGEQPAFALARQEQTDSSATAGIIKDAGDDPDITHGAMVLSTVSPGPPDSGLIFRAGEGVGMVTKPGLPIPPGEPAINPVPRQMIGHAIDEVVKASGQVGRLADIIVEISIPGGAKLAEKTMNPRLGIVGGLSVLGTTGIVKPYSCASWIASIHRGIDVARAAGRTHVAASTGSTSEAAVAAHHHLPPEALLDMGDFVGGTLKYLRRHPIDNLTIAGGLAKMTKLAQGHMDLHSARSSVDFAWLAEQAGVLGTDSALAENIRHANTAAHVLDMTKSAELPLADGIADLARRAAVAILDGAPVAVETLIIDRSGRIIGRAGER